MYENGQGFADWILNLLIEKSNSIDNNSSLQTTKMERLSN
jgi:hypothetical protein